MATTTLVPWFRDFFADFLQKEQSDLLQRMGKRFAETYVENTWDTGQRYFVLDFLDSEVRTLTECDGWQRMYNHMKVLRKESQKENKHLTVMYNYITQRMREYVLLVRKLTDNTVIIKTDGRKKIVSTPMQDVVQCPEGCISENYNRHKDAVQRTLDELQACLVLAGGRKMSIQELADMTLAEAMFLCLPNNIRISVSQISLPR